MKKFLTFLCALSFLFSLAAMFTGCGAKVVLNVYNWGEYISDGSEGSYNTNKEFEKYYRQKYGVKIKVNYTTFASNEDMYAKISAGAVSYDVIVPSDYMIERLIKENKLLKLNFDNIPNYKNIGDEFKNLYYDINNEYSIPYTYGRVGIIYNAKVVDEADAVSWDLLWNSKYKSKILQFNNPRDAFGTAMYKLGIDVNTTDESEWKRALEELKKQKEYTGAKRVMDEIFNYMEIGEYAAASYYAGDYFTMRDNQSDNVDLKFYYPEKTNLFIDAMCIPTSCQNKEAAEEYINFMLDKDAAIANAEYIYYASPNSIVYNDPGYIEDMGEEFMTVLYPDNFNFAEEYEKYCFRDLDKDTRDLMNRLWDELLTK